VLGLERMMLMCAQIELEDSSQEWELHKQWFVWPHKIRVKMTKA